MFIESSRPRWYTEEIEALADLARRFCAEEVLPNQERWLAEGATDRTVWQKAGELGILLPDISTDYGGSGGSFAHEAAIAHELCLVGDTSFRPGKQIHVIAAHYIERYGTLEQRKKYLPRLANGQWIAAMGMTEPGGGTDLQNMRTRAIRSGDEYIIEGAKTFITNGSIADLIVLAVKTDPTQKAKGVSLVLFEAATAGFRVGRRLKKVGLHGSDTCELFFDGCRVPADAILGGCEGQGFIQMMQDLTYERALVGVNCAAVMEHAYAITVQHAKTRDIFEKRLLDLQHVRFELAEVKTVAMIARVFVDFIIERMTSGKLDTELASMTKWWASERQCEIVSRCLQLFGGHGYMMEYPIGRMFVDARIEPIYGGANELMKDLIGRHL
ncbi:acyl-CoA dehydrogenase family protein [Bradyrhizobium tropiciagri]|uniref:acyl-CoA dehydrogenase family protein n=1 Tax=Bradyrhizobium tropiciagri TaxID=312253 RepID=UPI001BA4CFFB|nr:acyl-CoA dehydrogenase family protein [Bradyrhizobium tropiciagri]MBR0899118.1 acyl-CoA dehydrogenase family protein [Bradyrhizobium tropiciagri]